MQIISETKGAIAPNRLSMILLALVGVHTALSQQTKPLKKCIPFSPESALHRELLKEKTYQTTKKKNPSNGLMHVYSTSDGAASDPSPGPFPSDRDPFLLSSVLLQCMLWLFLPTQRTAFTCGPEFALLIIFSIQ